MKLLKAEAGVNDGKAGLLSTAGLFAKGGIFDKKSESFNIQELDPYLLFDARSSMLGTLENPTLDLDPATPSTLDVITATRAGVATYTDPDGNIATASPDTVRVDYTQGAELTPTKFQNIGYTDFSQDWTLEDSTLPESQTTAPDGTTPVYELTENTGTSRHRLFLAGISLVVGQDYTVSAYVKKVSSGRFFLINSSALNGIKGFLNLDTGVATLTSGTGTIAVTDEGNGWYRLSVTAQATTTNGFVYMQLQNAQTDLNYTGTGASMLIWGPQVEEGTTASDFVANTTGSPKFITGATFGPRVPMILVEPSATNLVTYSEDFSQWSASNVDRLDGIPSPDGLTNAWNVQPSATSGAHLIGFYEASSAIKTYSVYAKANGYKYFRFNTGSSSNGFAEFDVESGVIVGTGGTYYSTSSIEDVGDGWFRCSVTFSAGAATTMYIVLEDNTRSSSFAGDGVSGLYLWGAQVEAGSVATSIIPTSGGDAAARTRAADDLVISGSAFSDFYNQSEGTLYGEMVRNTDPYDSYPVIFHAGASTDYIRLSTAGQYRARVSNVNQTNNTIGTFATGSVSRFAFSYKQNDFVGTIDGSSESTDTSGSLPSVNQLTIGSFLNTANYLQGHIRRIIYWPYHSDSL